MKTSDISIAAEDVDFFLTKKSVTLIFPKSHPFSSMIEVDRIYRIIVKDFQDSDSTDVQVNGTYLPVQNFDEIEEIPSEILFIPRYVRECPLRGVVRQEWATCFGPPSARHFLKYPPFRNFIDRDLDTYVKIINLEKVDYSLKSLERNYRHER
jgi:hypothetical protein